MIDAAHRFHGRGSLRFVYQHGKTVRGPLNALKYTRNVRRKTYRVSVVVSRKVHKSAVVRNRIRRRLYEIIRNSSASITAPYDVVITVFSDQIASIDSGELTQMIHKQLMQAGIIAAPGATPAIQHGIVERKERQS
jgi:ribonuclease P protein component